MLQLQTILILARLIQNVCMVVHYFFEYSKEIKNTFTLCDTVWLNKRNVYFNASKVLMMFYTYQEYSSVLIDFKVSLSECKLVKITPCEPALNVDRTSNQVMKFYILHPESCSVVQVSSGLHEINEEVEKSVAGGMLGRYPDCVALFLNIDQSKYKDMSALYFIRGYLHYYSEFMIQSYKSNNFIGNSTITTWNTVSKTETEKFSKLFNLMNHWVNANAFIRIYYHVKRETITYFFKFYLMIDSWLNFVVQPSQSNFHSEKFSNKVVFNIFLP